MNAFEEALEREDYELASLYLALGFLKVLRTLPPDAVESLIEMLDAEGPSAPLQLKAGALSPRSGQHPHRRRDRQVRRLRRRNAR